MAKYRELCREIDPGTAERLCFLLDEAGIGYKVKRWKRHYSVWNDPEAPFGVSGTGTRIVEQGTVFVQEEKLTQAHGILHALD